MRRPSLLVVFLTVFIDLIGFGIVLPLLPIYSRNFGANGFTIGAIMASFSAMQFLFAPAWGRLSDRIGRRPVLLVSTAGAALSYITFALGSGLANPKAALLVLFGSRIVAGVCGANITVAQAYTADITPPAERSKKMGLIGMAFGLGFVCGPPLGGTSLKLFGLTGPGWVAAGLCAANFILAWAILTESWSPASERAAARPRLHQWAHTMGHPKIAVLIVVFFLATFCFACFELTLGLLVARNFDLDTKSGDDAWTSSILFAYCGIVAAFVQGGAIGRAVKAMGEPKLIAFSLMLVAISLAPLPFIHGHDPLSWHVFVTKAGLPWINLLFFLGLLAIGSGLTRPPVFGLISNLTPAHEQGATIGIAQSAGSFARIFGPIFAGVLFEHHPALPYLICGGIALLAALLAWQSLCRRDIAMAPAAVPSAEEP